MSSAGMSSFAEDLAGEWEQRLHLVVTSDAAELPPVTDRARCPRTGDLDGAAFALDEAVDVSAVWGSGSEVLWAEGEPAMLYGPDGVGKTSLGQQLLLKRIGIGAPELFGLPIAHSSHKALYLALDRPKQAARSLRRMVTDADRETLRSRLTVWRGEVPFDLTRDPEALARFAIQRDADSVWIDSLKDLAPKLSDEDTGMAIHKGFQACVSNGIEVLALHHPRKAQADNKKPRALADVSGSRWITAGMGSVMLLWGDAGDPVVELEHLKQPGDIVGPLTLLHDNVAGTTTVIDTKDVLEIVRGSAAPLTARQVAAVMFAKPEPSPNEVQKARRRLNAEVSKGRLIERPIRTTGGEGTGYAIA